MSTPSVLFLAPSTLDSDLPVVVFASATPQIDSDAPPELDSRVSRVSAEPIAAPARARTVEDDVISCHDSDIMYIIDIMCRRGT